MAHSTLIASYWCGSEQLVPSSIETPFFPAAYPAYATCEWLIRSPVERQSVLIEGFSYQMQEPDAFTGECNRDSLTVSIRLFDLCIHSSGDESLNEMFFFSYIEYDES